MASPVAAPAPSPAVTEVIGAGEFREALNARGIVVVGFSTSWARPCRAALPPFAALAEKYARSAAPVSFLRVDVDELDDVAGAAGVVDTPTFVVYRGGAPVATVVGAFVGRVEEEVAKWLL
ncbi:thioredoxin-like protein [Zopfochytrium polystomum]|nr:thioredoxin-like protein [Zopfochytrium polystomum]